MVPLADIVDVYHSGISDSSSIRTEYSAQKEVERAKELSDKIEGIVYKKREQLGFEKVRPISLSNDQADSLRNEIRNDAEWVASLNELIQVLSPEVDLADKKIDTNQISIPWWNSLLVFNTSDRYDQEQNSLVINAKLSHSYITQLTRAGNFSHEKGDSLSISNVLVTADGLLVLGWRGGHTYSDTLMTVPAGSVEYYPGSDPLFPTLHAEFFEETGLSKEELLDVKLIGKVKDNTIGNNSLYVFRTNIGLSFAELVDRWSASIDQREHKYLIPLKNSPQHVLAHILNHPFDPTKVTASARSKTHPDNIGSILPPCAASLLTYYIQQEGMVWGRKAEDLLNGDYRVR